MLGTWWLSIFFAAKKYLGPLFLSLEMATLVPNQTIKSGLKMAEFISQQQKANG